MHPEWMNVLPRVGVSWDPAGDGRTSIRAGYGMNSDFIAGQFFFDAAGRPALRPRAAPDAHELSTIRGARSAEPTPTRPRSAPTCRSRRPRCSSRCRTISTRRASTAGTSGCSGRSATNMAVSATYLGNHMMNVWGDVTGNPGHVPAGRVADRPVHAQDADRTAVVRQLLEAPLDLRRELTQADPGGRAIHRVPRLGDRSRLAALPRPAAVGAAADGERDHRHRQLHGVSRAGGW